MKGRDLGELAVRNLREAILRNSLTTLGVAVGVASLVAMLSLGVGLQTLASERLTKSGLFDAVFVTSRRDFRGPGGDGPPRKSSAPPEKFKPLDEDARQQFAALPNVVDVYPQIRFLTDVRYAGNSYATNVLGVPESSRATSAFDAITGKYFSSPTAEEAILQSDFAKELSPQPASLVGQEITLRYAERRAVSSDEISKEQDIDKQLDEMMSGGISIRSPARKNCASPASSSPTPPPESAASAAAASSFPSRSPSSCTPRKPTTCKTSSAAVAPASPPTPR